MSRRIPAHVTLKIRAGIPSLRSVRFVREAERSFRVSCDRGDFRLVHYTLQHNHAHLIVEATDACALARGMKAIGSRLARAVNRVFGRRGPVLLERFHLRVLRTPLEVRRALAYVLLNARRHAERVKYTLGVDPGSSGRWFDGWTRLPSSQRPGAASVAAVAAARTWLLRVGWRKHGLIDPNERPGPGGSNDQRLANVTHSVESGAQHGGLSSGDQAQSGRWHDRHRMVSAWSRPLAAELALLPPSRPRSTTSSRRLHQRRREMASWSSS